MGLALLRAFFVVHWALPSAAAIAAGLLFDHHPLLVAGVALAGVALRPVHTGPILRTVVVVLMLSPLWSASLELYKWMVTKVIDGWEFIGTFPSIFLRIPSHLIYIVLFLVVATVGGFLQVTLILAPLFALIGLESRGRQSSRDRQAGRIMALLEDPTGGPPPRFSLYLRPFATTGHLASNAVGVQASATEQPGNIQTDFEAILAAGFPAHLPLIALGRPGTLLSTQPEGVYTWPVNRTWDIPGTGKVACTEDDWQDKVKLLARQAELIVIVPLAFAGTLWEIRWLHKNRLLDKCVFVMPATMAGARDYSPAWKKTTRVLRSLGVRPPAYQESGQLLMVVEGEKVMRSLPSFVHAPLPRATALLLQFAFLRQRRRKLTGDRR
ncbi:hypothetical protein AB0B45_23765 [Nonomuraea sp. NPDC049152]|uniref:hypothetical protein n=1 Tax=Nonomuraea sp. NPDC049152 TaxID=3154350 RepID=UPI0033CC3E25